jgi:hypothetical protein
MKLQPSSTETTVIGYILSMITFYFTWNCLWPCFLSKIDKHNVKIYVWLNTGAGVAQLILCLTTDWTARVRSLEEAKDFSSSLCIHTSNEAHPSLVSNQYWECFTRGKVSLGRDADHLPHLVPRQDWVGAIPSLPWHLHCGKETALLLI